MARFEDSPDLFGNGMGSSSCGEIICEVCGKVYNKGIGVDEDEDDDEEGDSILNTEFAGLQVCECCFEKIENETLRRMPDILKWYKKIIASKKNQISEAEALLN
jgi:hypothetical protein